MAYNQFWLQQMMQGIPTLLSNEVSGVSVYLELSHIANFPVLAGQQLKN